MKLNQMIAALRRLLCKPDWLNSDLLFNSDFLGVLHRLPWAVVLIAPVPASTLIIVAHTLLVDQPVAVALQ